MALAELLAYRIARFWERVDRSGGPDACWPWTGPAYTSTGYGQATTIHDLIGSPPSDSTTAHRQAWIIANGPVGTHLAPSGRRISDRVRHRCPGGPNRLCCNPAHLGVGSDKDNADDRAADGNTYRGELVFGVKLTEAIVREALLAHVAGATPSSLAKQYGVHQATMASALHGDTWAHVAPELQRPQRPQREPLLGGGPAVAVE